LAAGHEAVKRRVRRAAQHLGQDGLFWPEIPADDATTSPMRLLSFTDELDAYFAHKEGRRRRRAKRPRQRLRRDLRALLDHFDDVDEPGWLEAQLVLLELDEPSAARIAGSLRRLKPQAERDGVIRDASFMFPDGSFGVSVMAAPAALTGELSRRLIAHCILKKHRMRYARWYGYGCHAGAKGLISDCGNPGSSMGARREHGPSRRVASQAQQQEAAASMEHASALNSCADNAATRHPGSQRLPAPDVNERFFDGSDFPAACVS
jgi:hypothetical protein